MVVTDYKSGISFPTDVAPSDVFQRQPSWHGPSLSQMPRGRRPHHHSIAALSTVALLWAANWGRKKCATRWRDHTVRENNDHLHRALQPDRCRHHSRQGFAAPTRRRLLSLSLGSCDSIALHKHYSRSHADHPLPIWRRHGEPEEDFLSNR